MEGCDSTPGSNLWPRTTAVSEVLKILRIHSPAGHSSLSWFHVFMRQMTGLLQALDEIKGVHLEPRGQGKIDAVLAEYYVSLELLSGCEHLHCFIWATWNGDSGSTTVLRRGRIAVFATPPFCRPATLYPHKPYCMRGLRLAVRLSYPTLRGCSSA